MKVQAVLNPRVHLVCNEKLRCVVNFSTIFFICGFHWLDADQFGLLLFSCQGSISHRRRPAFIFYSCWSGVYPSVGSTNRVCFIRYYFRPCLFGSTNSKGIYDPVGQVNRIGLVVERLILLLPPRYCASHVLWESKPNSQPQSFQPNVGYMIPLIYSPIGCFNLIIANAQASEFTCLFLFSYREASEESLGVSHQEQLMTLSLILLPI